MSDDRLGPWASCFFKTLLIHNSSANFDQIWSENFLAEGFSSQVCINGGYGPPGDRGVWPNRGKLGKSLKKKFVKKEGVAPLMAKGQGRIGEIKKTNFAAIKVHGF